MSFLREHLGQVSLESSKINLRFQEIVMVFIKTRWKAIEKITIVAQVLMTSLASSSHSI